MRRFLGILSVLSLATLATLATAVWAPPTAAADPSGAAGSNAEGGAPPARRARVVARVGPRSITVGEVEDRLAALAPVQRASFGGTREAVRRRFLDEVLVTGELLALGADEAHLASEQPAALRVERALSGATVRAVRARVGPASAVPEAAVAEYYEKNRARYDAPERYQIWRILCKTREEAQSVLDAARADPSAANFSALARDHSLDKATNLRAGNLGFIDASGAGREPGLRVDVSVVRAAQAVHDGELVPAPVAEGDLFAVVWRRATLPPVKRSLEDAEPQIRDALWKARVKEETDKLVASLRAAHLRDLHVALLDAIDVPADAPPVGASAVPR